MRRLYGLASTLILTGGLSACAVYHAVPLPQASTLGAEPPQATMNLSAVDRYAIAHSPDLAVERRRAEVSMAQAYQGGLLPDPQVSASVDHPTVHRLGLANGYALGLAEDLQALLTEPSRAEGAEARQQQARLELLWAEWQTLQRATSLYVHKIYADDKLAVLRRTASILLEQARHSTHALKRHGTSIDVAGVDLSAALDITSQKDSAARAAVATDADLKALLGLAPTASLKLDNPGDPPAISREDVEKALKLVRQTRPDLLALQAGYHAQDEAVRTAILQQFPAINLGFNRASDTSNIQSNGLGVTLNIPIFGSTQAKIRLERATREQLRAEYQARLDQTTADAWRIWQTLVLLRSNVDRLAKSVPALQKMATTSQRAYSAGNLPPATYALIETSLSARQGELFDLRATLWDDTIALRTLLAMSPLVPGISGFE